MLAVFAGMHYYMVFKNTGTLDSMVPMFRKKKNIYDIGAMNNFRQVFGNDAKYWFLPVFTSLGDGCSFPVNSQSQEENQDEENLPNDSLINL
mmetsp:Transcript_48868/g.74360  ORF Transcript_48868/g.74360 Transcript_48868/m.74360 type:complete len:92 (+) Transcript_48868:87-362(+)